MNDPQILFGIETEFGITRETERGEELDVVAESIALVRAATDPGVRMRWDYRCEDPHADTRGFRVDELRQDTDEAGYFEQDAKRPLSFAEIKSDLVLANGARFYNDHAHPEYCTPECTTPDDLVAQDRAGERIVIACAKRLSEMRGTPVRIYKNNTDFLGHSYGCHENYLLPRSLPWDDLCAGIETFLVTRQIFCGAGKFGFEEEDRFAGPGFQISQRADFFSELQSVDTMQRRPLINTRDEPHADPRKWRRFHVILGDANPSPFATRLKVASTALVLETLVRNPKLAWHLPRLANPLDAVRSISRDPKWRWELRLKDGTTTTALEIQRRYLEAVRATANLDRPEWRTVFSDWNGVLDDLAVDPMRCGDRLDWVAKLALIRRFQESEGVAEDDPWLRSLDLAYSHLDPEEGLYAGLEAAGMMRETASEDAILRAVYAPPTDTRAAIRGLCVSRFGDAVIAAQWDHVTLRTSEGALKIDLTDLFDPAQVAEVRRAIESARTADDLEAFFDTANRG
jgi:proteasome accessory factor PafA2